MEGQIGGRITMKNGRGRRSQRLLGDIKETRIYWKVKDAAIDRNMWRT